MVLHNSNMAIVTKHLHLAILLRQLHYQFKSDVFTIDTSTKKIWYQQVVLDKSTMEIHAK